MSAELTDVLTYRCPNCRKELAVDFGLLGETISCPECDHPFRPEAPVAHPIEVKHTSDESESEELVRVSQPMDDEQMIRSIHPAMFRNNPFLYTVGMLVLLAGGLLLLGYVGVGALPSLLGGFETNSLALWTGLVMTGGAFLFFAGWFIKTRFISLTITNERSIYQRGIISRRRSEVRHDDVRNLQINQSIFQRIMGVGTVAISSSGQDDLEIVAKAIPGPGQVAQIVRQYQTA